MPKRAGATCCRHATPLLIPFPQIAAGAPGQERRTRGREGKLCTPPVRCIVDAASIHSVRGASLCSSPLRAWCDAPALQSDLTYFSAVRRRFGRCDRRCAHEPVSRCLSRSLVAFAIARGGFAPHLIDTDQPSTGIASEWPVSPVFPGAVLLLCRSWSLEVSDARSDPRPPTPAAATAPSSLTTPGLLIRLPPPSRARMVPSMASDLLVRGFHQAPPCRAPPALSPAAASRAHLASYLVLLPPQAPWRSTRRASVNVRCRGRRQPARDPAGAGALHRPSPPPPPWPPLPPPLRRVVPSALTRPLALVLQAGLSTSRPTSTVYSLRSRGRYVAGALDFYC